MLKGMTSTQLIATLSVGLLFAVTGLQAVNSFHSSSLDDDSESIGSVLDSFSQVVDIGKNVGSETAEKQFRGLVVWNMLAASDCRIIGRLKRMTEEGNRRNKNFKDIGGNQYAFLPEDSFDKLSNTNFEKNCVGGGSIPYDKNPFSAITWSGDKAQDPGYDMEAGAGRLAFKVHETFRINGGDYTPTGSKNNRLLMMGSAGFGGAKLPDFWVGSDQADVDFFDGFSLGDWEFSGRRASYFVPTEFRTTLENKGSSLHVDCAGADECINPFDNDENNDVEKIGNFEQLPDNTRGSTVNTGQHWGLPEKVDPFEHEEKYYAWRVRMEGIPKLISGSDGFKRNDKLSERIEGFTENVQYVICEGSSGYVKTNARHMDYEGEASSDLPYVEDTVFPKVEITSNATGEVESGEDCIEADTDRDLPAVLETPDGSVKKCKGSKAFEDTRDPIEIYWGSEQITYNCVLSKKTWQVDGGSEVEYYGGGWEIDDPDKCRDTTVDLTDQYKNHLLNPADVKPVTDSGDIALRTETGDGGQTGDERYAYDGRAVYDLQTYENIDLDIKFRMTASEDLLDASIRYYNETGTTSVTEIDFETYLDLSSSGPNDYGSRDFSWIESFYNNLGNKRFAAVWLDNRAKGHIAYHENNPEDITFILELNQDDESKVKVDSDETTLLNKNGKNPGEVSGFNLPETIIDREIDIGTKDFLDIRLDPANTDASEEKNLWIEKVEVEGEPPLC